MEEASVIRLAGALTIETAAAHLHRPHTGRKLVFDLGGVTQVDSSALALLLAWMRRAKEAGSEIEFRAMPEPLLALARLYGIDALLPSAAA